jgi:hypothetical protein
LAADVLLILDSHREDIKCTLTPERPIKKLMQYGSFRQLKYLAFCFVYHMCLNFFSKTENHSVRLRVLH